MTKPVTSVAVMMLCEEGKLKLDDPIATLLPDRKADQVIVQVNADDGTFSTEPVHTPVTIRHLLTHTSGYGYTFTSSTLDLLQSKSGKWPTELPLLHQQVRGGPME